MIHLHPRPFAFRLHSVGIPLAFRSRGRPSVAAHAPERVCLPSQAACRPTQLARLRPGPSHRRSAPRVRRANVWQRRTTHRAGRRETAAVTATATDGVAWQARVADAAARRVETSCAEVTRKGKRPGSRRTGGRERRHGAGRGRDGDGDEDGGDEATATTTTTRIRTGRK